MILAISGTQGVGKTTFMSLLKNNSDIEIIEQKTSRSILSEWGVTNLSAIYSDRDLMKRFQDEIYNRHFLKCKSLSEKNGIHVIERSFADIFSYSAIILGAHNDSKEWLSEFYYKCKEAQKIFDNVFYLTRQNFSPENDGVRSTSEHFNNIVSLVIRDYLKKFGEEKVVYLDITDLKESYQNFIDWAFKYEKD